MAQRIGAINTIVVQPDGTLKGFNNDGIGFVQSISDAKPDWRPGSEPILVLGAGGAARAVVVALIEQGRERSGLLIARPSARSAWRRRSVRLYLFYPGSTVMMRWPMSGC